MFKKKIPEINISKLKFNEAFLRKIYLDNSIIVADLLKNEEKEIYDLDCRPNDICFKDDQIIISYWDDNCLKIYDKDLNFIKRVDRINGEVFKPLTVLANLDDEKFYICDNHNHRILITDLDFNFIKSVGSKGSNNFQFNVPYEICFSSSKFFICDYYNKRLQVYLKDFDFETSLEVEYNPCKIKSVNCTICVVANSPSGIYFYNSNDYHLIRN